MDNKKYGGILFPRTGIYLWTIFILVLVISIMNWRIAIPLYLLLLFLIFHNYTSNYNRHKEIARYIENLTFNINSASKDTLLNFPMPLVVLELNGTPIWYNSLFRKVFDSELSLEKTINRLVDSLHLDNVANKAEDISSNIEVSGRHYRVLGNYVKIEGKGDVNNYILLLYFIDNTEFVELERKYHEEKLAACIIIIDNYDDLMQSMEDPARPLMLAEIEKKIVQWIGFIGGILKKYERDKYLLVFEYKYLKEMEEKKFDILDTVKEINVGNKIPVTLSIGIGINEDSLARNFASAGNSIDIALGRGGDQVVIKNRDTFRFFGGRTRELEKRTRVKARVIAYALRELIIQSSSILIMGHENGDVDSLGASLGVYRVARNRGKNAHIVLNQSNPTIDNLVAKINRNAEYKNLFINRGQALDMLDDKTLLIVLDTHRPGFTECPELLERVNQVVVIDHHRKGTDFIQDAVLTYQETYASSTCEMVTEILQYVDEKIGLTPLEAEALYAGIVVDTKNFTFKTGVRTFEAASFLRRQGVDTLLVKQLFQNDLETYSNISNVVKDAEILNNDIAISVCSPKVRNAQLITAKAADELLNLTGISAAFVLTLINGEVFISGRSLGDINVQLILEKLGGGGHLTVAGAQLRDMSIEDARDKLKYVIIEYIKETSTEGNG